ncbi:unnamed protein product [Caenorhabditis angaria]|uniref:Uncharacterized protein n=1 Tax=Caenorhabditis angaria TaxID=860376 RepID=A0A9P1J1C3_9PELO|nr:unnamed protein product [Caenorhabditis angaria]
MRASICLVVIFLIINAQAHISDKKPIMGADELRLARECRVDKDGKQSVACPRTYETICIRYEDLCNNIPDCPDGADEDRIYCLMHNLRAIEISELDAKVEELKG